jgi:hypothetical protein
MAAKSLFPIDADASLSLRLLARHLFPERIAQAKKPAGLQVMA